MTFGGFIYLLFFPYELTSLLADAGANIPAALVFSLVHITYSLWFNKHLFGTHCIRFYLAFYKHLEVQVQHAHQPCLHFTEEEKGAMVISRPHSQWAAKQGLRIQIFALQAQDFVYIMPSLLVSLSPASFISNCLIHILKQITPYLHQVSLALRSRFDHFSPQKDMFSCYSAGTNSEMLSGISVFNHEIISAVYLEDTVPSYIRLLWYCSN